MYDTASINPLVFQPERQLWLRTLFFQSTIVRKEPLETVARILGISRTTAYRWRQQFFAGDDGGLLDRRFGPSAVMVMAGLRKLPGDKEDMPCRR